MAIIVAIMTGKPGTTTKPVWSKWNDTGFVSLEMWVQILPPAPSYTEFV